MDTHTPVQHISDPSSHNEDAVDAGGRNGYPSDSQAALNKNYVDLSDERDQADEELALVTSGPVSAHTRSKCIGASRKGDGGTRPVGDDDATVMSNYLTTDGLKNFTIYFRRPEA